MDRAAHGFGIRGAAAGGGSGGGAGLEQHDRRAGVGPFERSLPPGISRRGRRAGGARQSGPQFLARPQGLRQRAFPPTPTANPPRPSLPRRVSVKEEGTGTDETFVFFYNVSVVSAMHFFPWDAYCV